MTTSREAQQVAFNKWYDSLYNSLAYTLRDDMEAAWQAGREALLAEIKESGVEGTEMNKELEAIAIKVANDQTWSIDTFSPVFDQELLIFASRFLAAVQAQQEPVAWLYVCSNPKSYYANTERLVARFEEPWTEHPLFANPPAIPEDKVLVPRELTLEMYEACCCSMDRGFAFEYIRIAYKDMIAAAQEGT